MEIGCYREGKTSSEQRKARKSGRRWKGET
jgi:hypothetical protein